MTGRNYAGLTLLSTALLICSSSRIAQSAGYAVPIAAADGDPRLVEAVREGDSSTVRALLKQGADVNAPLSDGATALHWAAYRDDRETADLLIRAGAKVAAVNDLNVSPLWLAATNGSVPMVTRLLDAGADPNVAPETGGTPLMKAVRSGNVELVRLLLTRGADVNAREGSSGQTALMYAVALRRPEIVKTLLDARADIHARSKSWRQSYLICCIAGNGDKTNQVALERGGYTSLLFAARTGDIDSAKLLIAAGANVNDVAPEGTSALVVAAFSNHSAFATFLLENGADPHSAAAGYGALHAAVLREDVGLVRALIARGADPNARLTEGSVSTRYGALWSFHRSWIGATPLWLAAGLGNVDLIRILVASGGDARLTTADGTTLLMVASESIDPRYSGNGDRSRRRPEPQALAAVKVAFELGGDVNAKNTLGDTALHKAGDSRYNVIMQLLVEKGAAINPKNAMGLTPLDLVLSCLRCHNADGQDLDSVRRDAARGQQSTAAALHELGGTSENVLGQEYRSWAEYSRRAERVAP